MNNLLKAPIETSCAGDITFAFGGLRIKADVLAMSSDSD